MPADRSAATSDDHSDGICCEWAGLSECDGSCTRSAASRYALWDSSVQGVGPRFASREAAARFRAALSPLRQLDLTLVTFDVEEGAWVDA